MDKIPEKRPPHGVGHEKEWIEWGEAAAQGIPATLPPYCTCCLPCIWRHCRDGDTVVISVQNPKKNQLSSRHWAIRLIDVWCPEKHTPEGKKAKHACEMLLEEAGDLSVWIPPPKKIENILANLTFDRIPGYIWLGQDQTLNEVMIRRGYGQPD